MSFPFLSQILPKNAMKTARTAKRVAVPGIALFIILLFFWTYSSRFYRPLSVEGEGTSGAENLDNGPQPEDKILVMAKMETENTDWVMENLPEYCPILTPNSYFSANVSQAGNMLYITWTTRHPNSMSQRTKAVKAWHT
jgi:hypothetical protein